MSIKYLIRKEIDDNLWNKKIEESCNTLIYGFTWYLDAATNKSWDALVLNDYEFIMPLPKRRKFFISYIFLPLFTQQLGIFGRSECSPELVADFFNAIPEKYKLVNISTSNDVTDVQGFNKIVRQNQILDLRAGYEAISAKYNKNAKYNIREANKHQLTVKENIDFDTYLNFQKKWSPVRDFIYSNRKTIENIIDAVQKQCEFNIVGVYDNKELISVIFYIVNSQRVHLIDGSSNIIGRKKKSSYLLLDYLIRKYANSKQTFDFSGSSIKSVAYRNLSFTSVTDNYTVLTLNKLPWFVRLIKKI